MSIVIYLSEQLRLLSWWLNYTCLCHMKKEQFSSTLSCMLTNPFISVLCRYIQPLAVSFSQDLWKKISIFLSSNVAFITLHHSSTLLIFLNADLDSPKTLLHYRIAGSLNHLHTDCNNHSFVNFIFVSKCRNCIRIVCMIMIINIKYLILKVWWSFLSYVCLCVTVFIVCKEFCVLFSS